MNLKIAALFGLIGSCILTLYTLYNITMFIEKVGFQATWIIERFVSLTGWIFITIFFVFFYIQQKSPTDE